MGQKGFILKTIPKVGKIKISTEDPDFFTITFICNKFFDRSRKNYWKKEISAPPHFIYKYINTLYINTYICSEFIYTPNVYNMYMMESFEIQTFIYLISFQFFSPKNILITLEIEFLNRNMQSQNYISVSFWIKQNMILMIILFLFWN